MSNKIVMSVYVTLIDSFFWYNKMGQTEEKFNELIDKINKKPQADFPIAARKGIEFEDCVNSILNKKQPPLSVGVDGTFYITENFKFKKDLVDKIVAKLINHKSQQKYMQAIVPTPVGDVKVYGFADYDYDNLIVDLKTGAKYVYGKYKVYNQHKAYPLIERINGRNKDFVYHITDFENIFFEKYNYKTEYSDEFTADLVKFYEFLEENRAHIVHPKIWGL